MMDCEDYYEFIKENITKHDIGIPLTVHTQQAMTHHRQTDKKIDANLFEFIVCSR